MHVAYTGILNDKLRGFYLSKTAKRKYAVTQFEATDARRAFPCFDEPAFKATFAVTLVIDRRDMAISNGKVLSDVPGPAATQHTLKFATSPKMSSYLVAMAVGDFQCVSGAQDGIPIRICATPENKDLLGRRARIGAAGAEILRHVLLDQVSVHQARRRRRAGLRRRRDGKHGRDLLPGNRSARGSQEGVGRHAQEHRVDPGARDGAPVVRRSRDDGLVGRHLAERRVRDVDGEPSARGVAARLERRPSTRRPRARRRSASIR